MANETRRVTIYINGKEIENSIRGIRSESTKLRNELNNMTKGTAEYERKVKEFNKLNNIIQDHNSKLRGTSGIWGKIKTEVKQFGAMAIAYLGAGQIVSGIDNIIQRSADLEDAFADVAKTTGLTIKEVEALNKKLTDIDTRSSRNELLGLAQVAGKLGISAEADILKFVESADKINVALSEDLGGDIEGTVRDLGKLVELFGIKEEFGIGEGLNKVGSAINSVGAASTANEGFLVNFATRVGGIAPAAKLSLPQILGIGSALDQLGQQAETSSTVFAQILPKMFSDTKIFADIAGQSVDDFKKLLAEDSNEALLQFLEGLNKNNGGLEELSTNLDGMGLSGSKAIGVLSALSNNTELLRKEQDLANISYEEGTSLTEEFSIKNNTLGAVLDKLKKKISATFVSGEFNAVLKEWLYWLEQNWEWLTTLIKSIVQITLVIGAYKAAMIAINGIQKAYQITTIALSMAKATLTANTTRAAAAERLLASTTVYSDKVTKIAMASTHLLSAAKALLTGNLTKARASMLAFNATLGLSPIGIVLASMAALYALMKLYNARVAEATRVEKMLISVRNEAARAVSREKAELDSLLQVAKDETQSKADRLKAIEAINRISPEYLGNITLENINTEEGIKIIENYIKALDKKALAQAVSNKKAELYEQLLNAETINIEENIKWHNYLTQAILSGGNAVSFATGMTDKAIDNRANNIAKIKEEIAALNNLIENKVKSGELDLTDNTNGLGAPITPADNKNAEKLKKELEEMQGLWQKYQDFVDKATDDRLKRSLSSYDYEYAQIKQKFADKMQFLVEQGLQETELMVELKRLQNEELSALQIEHIEEFAALREELENEIFIQSFDTLLENENLKLSALREIALIEVELERQKELDKVAEYENAAILKALIDEKYKNKIAKINRDFDETEEKQIKAKKAQDKADKLEAINATGAMLGDIAGMMNQGSKGWKALKVAEATISMMTSAQKAYESTVEIPIVGAVLAPIAAATAAAAGLMQIRKITATEIPQVQEQYYDGGFSKVKGPKDGKTYNARRRYDMYGGYVNEPSLVNGGNTLGGERGQEYWINDQMLNIPMVSNVAGALESLRTNKISTPDFGNIIGSITANRQFVNGGGTAKIPSFKSGNINTTAGNDIMMQQFMQLMEKINENLENPKKVPAVFNKDYFTEQMDLFNNIENDARG